MYSRFLPSRLGRRGSTRRAGFDGNLATLFPGAYQVLQSDRGLTYGGTPLATAGNTSTTTLALTGALATAPVPIWWRCINAGVIGVGAIFEVYLDGAGVVASQTIVFPPVGVPIALTGAATGLFVAFSVGAGVLNDTWKATCAALADQTANGKNAVQAGATAQPIVTVGLNGKPGLLFDGVNDQLVSTVQTLLTALPVQGVVVGRMLSTAANMPLFGTNGFLFALYTSGANLLREYNGSAGPSLAFSNTTPNRFSATYTGSVADSLRAGAGSATGSSSGAGAPSGGATVTAIGGFPALALFGNIEIFAMIVTPPTSLTTFDAAINSAGGYGPGSIVV